MPPAPGRFSTTNGWPSSSPSFAATWRAAKSSPPPGAVATSMRPAERDPGHHFVCFGNLVLYGQVQVGESVAQRSHTGQLRSDFPGIIEHHIFGEIPLQRRRVSLAQDLIHHIGADESLVLLELHLPVSFGLRQDNLEPSRETDCGS